MSRNRLGTLVVASVILAAAAGTLAARWPFRHAQPAPPGTLQPDEKALLWIPPERLDFGTVYEDEHFNWSLPLENREAESVEVEAFSASCNCLSLDPPTLIIGPGERRDLHLRVDLTSKSGTDERVEVRFVAKIKAGTLGGKRIGPEWKLVGNVRSVLSVDSVVYLGRHSEFTQPLPQKSIAVASRVPLESLSVHSEVPGVNVRLIPLKEASSPYSLLLTFVEPASPRNIEGSVILTPVLKGGVTLPARRMEVRGIIVSDLESQPPAIQVGGRRVGEVVEDIVTLSSLTGRQLGPITVSAEGDGLTVERVGAENRYVIRQIVRRAGIQSNRVIFSTTSGNKPVSVVVPVEFTGLERE